MKQLDQLTERAMGMNEAVWQRHLNPYTGWARVTALPLVALAVWSRAWLQWYCLIPIALVMAWVWLAARFFAPPDSTDNWMSRGVLGERLWLDRDRHQVDAHHYPIVFATMLIVGIGGVVMLAGLIALNVTWTIAGVFASTVGKLWFLDRMNWLQRDYEHYAAQAARQASRQQNTPQPTRIDDSETDWARRRPKPFIAETGSSASTLEQRADQPAAALQPERQQAFESSEPANQLEVGRRASTSLATTDEQMPVSHEVASVAKLVDEPTPLARETHDPITTSDADDSATTNVIDPPEPKRPRPLLSRKKRVMTVDDVQHQQATGQSPASRQGETAPKSDANTMSSNEAASQAVASAKNEAHVQAGTASPASRPAKQNAVQRQAEVASARSRRRLPLMGLASDFLGLSPESSVELQQRQAEEDAARKHFEAFSHRPAVTNQPRPAVAKETRPAVTKEPRPAVTKEPRPPVAKEAHSSVAVQKRSADATKNGTALQATAPASRPGPEKKTEAVVRVDPQAQQQPVRPPRHDQLVIGPQSQGVAKRDAALVRTHRSPRSPEDNDIDARLAQGWLGQQPGFVPPPDDQAEPAEAKVIIPGESNAGGMDKDPATTEVAVTSQPAVSKTPEPLTASDWPSLSNATLGRPKASTSNASPSLPGAEVPFSEPLTPASSTRSPADALRTTEIAHVGLAHSEIVQGDVLDTQIIQPDAAGAQWEVAGAQWDPAIAQWDPAIAQWDPAHAQRHPDGEGLQAAESRPSVENLSPQRADSPQQRIDPPSSNVPTSKVAEATLKAEVDSPASVEVAPEDGLSKQSAADALRAWVRQSMGQESASDDGSDNHSDSPSDESSTLAIHAEEQVVPPRPVDSLRAWVQAEKVAMQAKADAEAADADPNDSSP